MDYILQNKQIKTMNIGRFYASMKPNNDYFAYNDYIIVALQRYTTIIPH